MKTIAVASMFKDSQTFHGHPINQVDRYFAQMAGQQGRGDVFDLTFHLAVGTSADDTWEAVHRGLESWPGTREGDFGKVFRDQADGGPVASVRTEERLPHLSAAANPPFRSARDSGADYVLWVESDLIIGPGFIAALLDGFAAPAPPVVVAPLPVYAAGGNDLFYDLLCMRGVGDKRWGHEAVPWFRSQKNRYMPMESVGCAALMDGGFLRRIRADFGAGAFPVLCEAVRGAGGTIVCDTRTEIRHPSERLIACRLV